MLQLLLPMPLGAWVPVSTNSGLVLFRGNSPGTKADAGVNADPDRFRVGREVGEVERDRHFRRSAIDWVQENRQEALVLYAKKLLNHFNFRNQLYSDSEARPLRDLAMIATYYPLLFSACARFLCWKRFPVRRWEVVLALFYVGFAFLSAIFFTRLRYRLPLDYLLMIIVAALLDRVVGWRFERERRIENHSRSSGVSGPSGVVT